jgi:regulator of nucleoside diphosphate kinase
MSSNPREVSAGGVVVFLLVLSNAIVLKNGLVLHEGWYLFLPVTIFLLLTSLFIFLWEKLSINRFKLKYMKANEQNPVVITREDYSLLMSLINKVPEQPLEMSLGHELGRAIVVNKDAFPPHTVRLNSKVTVVNLETQRLMEFRIVMPEHADMTQDKVSILSPIGTALIGFRKGEEVLWKVPAGLKWFRILDVVNKD